MNAQSLALGPATTRAAARNGMFLGFGTVFRKEIREWVRGRRAIVVGAVALASAILTTVISYIVGATGQSGRRAPHAGPDGQRPPRLGRSRPSPSWPCSPP